MNGSVLSFGAGVQTTALLILIAEGKWPRPDYIVFADTGDEKVETYSYLSEITAPYAEQHGLNIIVIGQNYRPKSYQPTLREYCLAHHMVPGTWLRWCTEQYKRRPIHRWCRAVMGATRKNPVETWIGISMDEKRRAVPSNDPITVKRYPLIELGLSREDCREIIHAAGLPEVAKSGCWYCPFQRRAAWQHMKRTDPDRFDAALAIERNAYGRDGRKKYLPIFGSLESIAAQNDLPGFDEAIAAEGECVTGMCFV